MIMRQWLESLRIPKKLWLFHLATALTSGLVAAGIMGVHYAWIRGRDRMLCFKAFLHNNYVGLAKS